MKLKNIFLFLIILLILSGCTKNKIPDEFIKVKMIIPEIEYDLRYYGNNNFLGCQVDGYEKDRLILTERAAKALKNVQNELLEFGLAVKVFDGYRPQKAVDHFVLWAEDINDTLMKSEFYPDVKKSELFEKDYIAAKSSHSRGSTVDLTIISLPDKKELDMGSNFDFFGKQSAGKYLNITANQRANRLLLQSIMMKYGFRPYSEEWWHYTLIDEPFPETYFDFDIK